MFITNNNVVIKESFTNRELLLRQRQAKQQAAAKKLADAQGKEEKKRKADELKTIRATPAAVSSLEVQQLGGRAPTNPSAIHGTNIRCANPQCRGMYNKPKHSRQSCPAEWLKCLICKIEFCNLCHEVKAGHDAIHVD